MTKKNEENALKGAFRLETGLKEESAKNDPKPAGKKEPTQKDVMWKNFETNLEKFTGAKGQGTAVWLPDELTKRLKVISAAASRNLPVRAMTAAIVATFLNEFEKKIKKL